MKLPEQIGVGVIGVGIRGQHAYETFLAQRPDCRVVAVAQQPEPVPELLEGKDPDGCAREWAERLGAEYVADWRELLARSDVHLVSLMCDAAASPKLMREVAAAGKHIVRDKFLAVDVGDGEGAVAACEAAGVEVLMTYSLRYAPAVRILLQEVRRMAIGQPLVATVVYLRADGPLEGFTATAAYRRAMGGGELTTFGVYAADVVLEIFGVMPSAVFASTGTFFYDDYRAAGLEDLAQVTMTFPSGWVANFITGRTTTSPAPPCYFRIEVTGRDGCLTATAEEPRAEAIAGQRVAEAWKPAWAVTDMLDDFIACLRGGEPSPIPARRGLQVLRIIRAAYASAQRGEPVDPRRLA